MDDRHAWSRGPAERAARPRPVRDRQLCTPSCTRRRSTTAAAGSASTRCRPSMSRCTTSWASSSNAPRTSCSAGPAARRSRPYATIYAGRSRRAHDRRADGRHRGARSSARSSSASARSRWRSSSATSSATASSSAASARAAAPRRRHRRCSSTSATAGATGATRCGRSRGSRTATSTSPRRRSSTTTSTATRSSPARVETRIGGARDGRDALSECREWLERGGVDVLQPDVSRCGGLTELRRIAQLAELARRARDAARLEDGHHRRRRAPFPGGDPERPLRRASPPELFDSPLRRELVPPEPSRRRRDRSADRSGLGIELNADAVERYRG